MSELDSAFILGLCLGAACAAPPALALGWLRGLMSARAQHRAQLARLGDELRDGVAWGDTAGYGREAGR